MTHTQKKRIQVLKRENILYRWGLTAKGLTSIVDANPSMRGLMLGYVAEYKLKKCTSKIRELAP